MSYEEEDGSIVCPYCLSHFNDPVILPCGHNLCEECVEWMRSGTETSRKAKGELKGGGECEEVCDVKNLCPVCGKEFNKGDEKPNNELRKIICGKVFKCDACEGKRVAIKFYVHDEEGRRCLECFCEECWKIVHKTKSYKGLVPYEKPPAYFKFDGCLGFDGFINPKLEKGDKKEEKKNPICSKHHRPATRKMKESGEPICTECCLEQLDSWNPENIEKMEDVIQNAQKRLEREYKEIEGMLGVFEGYLNDIKAMTDECDKTRKEYLKLIDGYIEEYAKILEKAQKDGKDAVEKSCNEYASFLTVLRDECEDIVKWLKIFGEIRDKVGDYDDYRECLFEKRVLEIMSRIRGMQLRIGKYGDIRRLQIDFDKTDIPSAESVAKVNPKYIFIRPIPKYEAGYLLDEACGKHECGDHKGAFDIYSNNKDKYTICCFYLGLCYIFGVGVDKDVKQGFENLKASGGMKEEDEKWSREKSPIDRFFITKKLNLDGNIIGEDEAHLIAKLFMTNSTLTSLTMNNTQLGDAGTKIIGEELKTNSALTELSLNGNSIGDVGVGPIMELLKSNLTLTKLTLDDNNIGDTGAGLIGEALKVNSAVTELSLNGNGIGDAGTTSIMETLKTNSTLVSLHLERNKFGDAGATKIGEVIAANSTLAKLYINGNTIGEAGNQALATGKGNGRII